ncbi:HCP-like protein [Xylariaceae sp. FL0804]|nr:HCP-like protein [Xylariaceae sp. FL0804]
MASVTTTPPLPSTSSPSKSVARKPLPIPKQPQNDTPRSVPSNANASKAPRMKDMAVPAGRVVSQQEDWIQPSDASQVLPEPPDAPPPPPPSQAPAYTEAEPEQPSMKKPKSDKPLPTVFPTDLPHRSGQEKPLSPSIIQGSAESWHTAGLARPEPDSRNSGDLPQGRGPDRKSRDSDTGTVSTRKHASTEGSVETSASSVSGGTHELSDSQVPTDRRSLKDSIAEDAIPEEPTDSHLQYHHRPLFPRVASNPMETASRNSSKSDLAEPTMAINRHLTPNSFNLRRSSMTRPQSSYSAYSDFGARGRSPGLGSAQGRSPSQSRKSPDMRPISYAELLNVPYPQQAPAPIAFDNSQLRHQIGSNASLLSTPKTLEMYRQNVKKTNDFSIQYSFAVFLISTAQEQGLDHDEPLRKRSGPRGGPSPSGVESSPTELVREAKAILTRLANGGYPFAQYYLADGYASGLFNKGKEDYNAAFPLFVLAAKHGHAESGYRAGLCYEFGWGCRKDPAKAVQYLRTAASKNHPGAMTRLGKACLSGDLGENRYREGLKWLKRATESADTMYNAAPYFLGSLYETGYGEDIFKDEGYAAELFTQAAELGHAEASHRMGDAYEHGKLNCPRDPALSVHFYTGAAERGHAAAMMGLCAWYMVGADPILEKDEEEAYEWARRSAELGYVKAEYAVGYFTEMGIGCRRDILEANVWYVKAADSGDERAKQRLAAIRAAVSGGGTPMEVAPPRNAKMGKTTAKNDKDCSVM